MDWRNEHRQICKFLDVGHGDMQLRTNEHTSVYIALKERFEAKDHILNEGMNQFLKLFQESTLEGSQAAARKMKEIAKPLILDVQKYLLFHSLFFLARPCSDLQMLSWPNSPLLVLLQFVDPNVLPGDDDTPLQGNQSRDCLLHDIANLAAPNDYSTHAKQLILAKQLIEHGANVNAVSIPHGTTPLQEACFAGNVTNLDVIELLLEKGADPNSLDREGVTPLMFTTPYAPGAAKLLLNWPATDANITNRSGESFLTKVRSVITAFSDKVALAYAAPEIRRQFRLMDEFDIGKENAAMTECVADDHPDLVQHLFLQKQWRGIEVMLLERGCS